MTISQAPRVRRVFVGLERCGFGRQERRRINKVKPGDDTASSGAEQRHSNGEPQFDHVFGETWQRHNQHRWQLSRRHQYCSYRL